VRYAGTDILVTAQLIDPQSEAHLWSNTYPGDLSNLEGVFAMQADIAVKIANALDAALSPDEQRRLDVFPTKSPQAYVAFLRDRDKRDLNDFSNLDRAIELDPNFGLAYAVRGLKHATRAIRATVLPESADAIEEIRLAIADADRALAIDPDLGLAHIVSGARYLGPKRDRERMKECFERALALSPNDAWVLHLASTWYLAESLPREAHELLVRIEQLDPIDSVGSEPTRRIGEFFFLSGDLERSTQYLRRQVQQQPTAALWRHLLAFNEALLGNREEAIRQLDIAEELLADSPEDEVYRVGYAPVYAYSRIGRPADARRMFDRFLAAADDGDLLPMMWVMAYLGIGDVERAYEWAKVVVDRTRVPWPGPHLWLALNPMNDPVLERPEFLELRRKLGYRN
jgi:tetratricopeptide (TPR) repeat protein